MSTRPIQYASMLILLSATAVWAQSPPAAGPTSTVPPAPPRARGPASALAVEAVQTTLASCLKDGYKGTAVVVDSAGALVAMISADGAAERTQPVALSKTAIAIKYNVSSTDIVARAKTDPALDAELRADPKIGNPRPGGLLLKVGNDTIGAIAFSGAPGGALDEACAKAGLDKIKDRLR
jgi:uncharacterized protein GlcG (DUF336 family)